MTDHPTGTERITALRDAMSRNAEHYERQARNEMISAETRQIAGYKAASWRAAAQLVERLL